MFLQSDIHLQNDGISDIQRETGSFLKYHHFAGVYLIYHCFGAKKKVVVYEKESKQKCGISEIIQANGGI